MGRKGWNVLPPLSKRRDVDPDERQPLVKVGTHATLFNGGVNRTVYRCDRPQIQLHRLPPVVHEHFAVAKNADQSCLEPCRQLDDVLEKQDAAAGLAKPAFPPDFVSDFSKQ